MKRLWFIAALLFAVAMLVQMPAAWLAPWVANAAGGRLRLGTIDGTVWAGSASISAFERKSGRWQPGVRFVWRWVWSELARGRAAVQVDLEQGGGALVTAAFKGWSIERLDVSMPVGFVTSLLPGTLGEYGWSGTARANGNTFTCQWARPDCMGRVDLQWTGAAIDQIPGPPLGDFRVRIMAEGEALRFDLGTLRGRLQIAGSGELNRESLHFSGEAEARGEGSAGLEAVLRAVGRPGSAQGRYLIEYREARR